MPVPKGANVPALGALTTGASLAPTADPAHRPRLRSRTTASSWARADAIPPGPA